MALKTSFITFVLLSALVLAVQPASAMYTNPVVGAPASQERVTASSDANGSVGCADGRAPLCASIESRATARAGFEWSRLGIGLGIGLLLVTGSTMMFRGELRRRLARG